MSAIAEPATSSVVISSLPRCSGSGGVAGRRPIPNPTSVRPTALDTTLEMRSNDRCRLSIDLRVREPFKNGLRIMTPAFVRVPVPDNSDGIHVRRSGFILESDWNRKGGGERSVTGLRELS